MRKEAGFEVMDKITVYAEGSDKATGLMNANADSIKSDVMADALVTGSPVNITRGFICCSVSI